MAPERPPGTSDAAVAALGRLSEALEAAEYARGLLYPQLHPEIAGQWQHSSCRHFVVSLGFNADGKRIRKNTMFEQHVAQFCFLRPGGAAAHSRSARIQEADGRLLDRGFVQQHRVRGRAERDEAVLAGHSRDEARIAGVG